MFRNSVFRLGVCEPSTVQPRITHLLVEGERVLLAAKTIRDFAVFTDKRIIVGNVRGIIGRKTSYMVLPYSKIQAYELETAGTFDFDATLDVWYSTLGKVRLKFRGNVDVAYIAKLVSWHLL